MSSASANSENVKRISKMKLADITDISSLYLVKVDCPSNYGPSHLKRTLSDGTVVDIVQVDPPEVSVETLQKMLLDGLKVREVPLMCVYIM